MNLQNCQIGYRICISCKEEKPCSSDYFYKDKNRKDGLMYRCKDCDKKRKDNRTWADRKKNITPEQEARKKVTQKKYNKTLKGKSAFLASQYRAFDKERGYKNDITKQDVIDVKNKLCTYCNFPATGFDRIDNTLGHIKNNCVPCCKECNVARMDNFSHKEMFIIGKAIKEIKEKRLSIIPKN